MNASPRPLIQAEPAPAWLWPVTLGLTVLALVAAFGLRTSQRAIEREAQWREAPTHLEVEVVEPFDLTQASGGARDGSNS